MGEKESEELSAKGEDMKKALFHLKELSREEGLRLVEEAREKAWKDQMARERDSFNNGMEKGKAESRTDIIIGMLKKGMDMSLLSKFTGLSEKEIYKLRELEKE